MSFWSYFPRYVSVGEKKARTAKKLESLRKKQDVKPVIILGNAIARTWWGKAWNQNLERYADYSNRIGRGRSYVRHGAVLDLRIEAGAIKALVQGSRAKPYSVEIGIKKLNKNTWQNITTQCSGMLDSLQELLVGSFPKALGEIFMQRDSGLFPAPKDISFQCSCPDWASMCKHVAASLYGVGARLDEDPLLFFSLRGVDSDALIGKTVASKAESMLGKAIKKSARVIEDSDLSNLFGIDLADAAALHAGEGGRPTGGKRTKKSSVQEKRKISANKAAKRATSEKGVVRKKASSSRSAATKERVKNAQSGKKRR